ncbi:hypothetical protein LEL_08370 [Akanthomyces lecanii RCEF 1005]|uniref:Uncharacterized protein n=1 Tax=Akanthomyces lecanii RCEF 1005 TaxID=1081108 RepID=A0A162N365_CORDF|nr:hypothetical protein LEL_08370 [Akanthomyces lecanii RCEF 1005]
MTRFESDLNILGMRVIRDIPCDAEKYREWLKDTRDRYAKMEEEQDAGILTMSASEARPRGLSWPTRHETLAILRPDARVFSTVVIVNLDAEVLTMQYGAHFNLASFPHRGAQWRGAIRPSIYNGYPTLSLDFCGRDQMAEPAKKRRTPEALVQGHGTVRVAPKRTLYSGRDVFLAHALAKIYRTYHRAITRFGLEWDRDSFVLREFVFAILSIASGEAQFSSAVCCREYCFAREEDHCNGFHLNWQRPCFEGGDLGALEPCATFGSFFHRKGEVAGAAPAGHVYWMKGVVINISTVVDGAAIQEAIDWGWTQGKQEFQIIAMSVFDIAFAEVYVGSDKHRVVRFSDALNLSPLRSEECMSLHPLTRPPWSADAGMDLTPGARIVSCNSFGTAARLEKHYGGLAALVNFFKVATVRGVPPQNSSVLPTEILARIMSYADNETQRTCMQLSQSLCVLGFSDFRIDEEWSIAARPESVRKQGANNPERGLLALSLAHNATGEVAAAVQVMSANGWGRWTWVPVVGSGERRVLMTDVALVFAPAQGCELDEDAADGDVSHLECDDDSNY